jgi:hypothetical protein
LTNGTALHRTLLVLLKVHKLCTSMRCQESGLNLFHQTRSRPTRSTLSLTLGVAEQMNQDQLHPVFILAPLCPKADHFYHFQLFDHRTGGTPSCLMKFKRISSCIPASRKASFKCQYHCSRKVMPCKGLSFICNSSWVRFDLHGLRQPEIQRGVVQKKAFLRVPVDQQMRCAVLVNHTPLDSSNCIPKLSFSEHIHTCKLDDIPIWSQFSLGSPTGILFQDAMENLFYALSTGSCDP